MSEEWRSSHEKILQKKIEDLEQHRKISRELEAKPLTNQVKKLQVSKKRQSKRFKEESMKMLNDFEGMILLNL